MAADFETRALVDAAVNMSRVVERLEIVAQDVRRDLDRIATALEVANTDRVIASGLPASTFDQ